MTTQAISTLRRRMIEDMAIRKLAPKTQHDYVQRVKNFAAFLGHSPDTAKSEEVRRFRLHLASSGAGTPKINATVSALRFFFNVTLDRPDLAKHLSFMREPRKVPVVLSPEEVARFLEAAPSVKYKAALSVAYGAGLRVSEVVALKVSDIDSERMMLRVEQGKGHKDRYAMLSPMLLELLRDWYRIARPQGWLFPGQNPANPMTTRQLTRACHAAAHMAEITKRVTPHTPALPEVPGRGGKGLACSARGRPVAGTVLSRGIHAAGGHRRHRLSQQGGNLRYPVQGLGRDPDHDRR